MKNYHTEFKFNLFVLGPMHIGSGKKYTKKEYIYENEKYYFPDTGELYLKIRNNEKLSKKFIEFMSERNTGYMTTPLKEFLSKNNINDRDFGGYSIAESGYEFEKKQGSRNWNNASNDSSRNLNEIVAFVKDEFGNPYIPGSSLKGAIRTILVNEEFKTDDVPWKDGDNIFNEIRVSDSKPISVDNLTLVQKWDYNAKKNCSNSLPIWRESLKPLTRVEFTITTSSERARKLIENLSHYAKNFYQRYKNKFLSAYPDSIIQKNIGCPIYLGAGSGLWTKVDYHHVRIDKIQEKSYKKMKMKGNGVLKLTRYKKVKIKTKDGKYIPLAKDVFYEMGKCGFSIKEVDVG